MNLFWIWMRYFLMAPGLPAKGDLNDGDCIIIPAIGGRNQYLNHHLGLVRGDREKYSSDHRAILQLLATGFDPGLPDRGLAQECQNLYDKYHKPVITQWEVATGFEKEWYEQNQDNVICVWPPLKAKKRFGVSRHYTTVDVLKDAAKVMAKHNWRQAIILAHRRHIARAYLLARKFLPQSPLFAPQNIFKFDSKSLQWLSRNNFNWFAYEIPGRLYHVLTGLVV